MTKHHSELSFVLEKSWADIEDIAVLESDDTKKIAWSEFVAHNFPDYVSLKVEGQPLILFKEHSEDYSVRIYVSPQFIPWCTSHGREPKQTMDFLLCMNYEKSSFVEGIEDEEAWFRDYLCA